MKTDSPASIIQEILTTSPPAFTNSEAAGIAADIYGIHASARLLVSERDQNFKLDTGDGQSFTLKISNHAEKLDVIDFQNQALIHVATRAASLPLPRVMPALDGQLHSSVERAGKTHFVRLLSWLDGTVIHDSVVDAELAGRMGQLLARLDGALSGFDHPGSGLPLLWDMKRAAGLADLVIHIKEPDLRKVVDKTLDTFITRVKPVLGTLRTQVIHNDMNPGNVLMDRKHTDKIAGLIDFGDMTRSPLIIDLAVAAAYQLHAGDDPLAGALPMIAGYHSVEPLSETEMELLTDLVRTRLITSLLIGSYRSILFPENREYLMISYRAARGALENLENLQSDEAFSRICRACADRPAS